MTGKGSEGVQGFREGEVAYLSEQSTYGFYEKNLRGKLVRVCQIDFGESVVESLDGSEYDVVDTGDVVSLESVVTGRMHLVRVLNWNIGQEKKKIVEMEKAVERLS